MPRIVIRVAMVSLPGGVSSFRWEKHLSEQGAGRIKIVSVRALGENGLEDRELAADGQKWKVQEFKIQ